jgi:hypothetical protein
MSEPHRSSLGPVAGKARLSDDADDEFVPLVEYSSFWPILVSTLVQVEQTTPLSAPVIVSTPKVKDFSPDLGMATFYP